MFRRERKGLIVLALLVAFAAGPGAAEAAGGTREAGDLWSRLLGWLGAQIGMGTAPWGDEGPFIDPNGRPRATANGDAGHYIDPNGRPQATTNGDVGPFIDPNGRPQATTNGDTGPYIDPNGRPR